MSYSLLHRAAVVLSCVCLKGLINVHPGAASGSAAQEEESMRRLVAIIDKSNGYVYAGIIKKVRTVIL